MIGWIFNPYYRATPTGLIVERKITEPAGAFIEYTGIPALLGGSAIPVGSQVAFQGGQAKVITQPTAAKVGKPLTFGKAFALEFVGGTILMAGVLTLFDPMDHRTGGLVETTWYKNNFAGWYSVPTSGGYWDTSGLDL